jgi:hypothetical protein
MRSVKNQPISKLIYIAIINSLLAFSVATASPPVLNGGPDDEGHDHQRLDQEGNPVTGLQRRPDPGAALIAHDALTAGIISSGPSAKIIKNLDLTGRGERNVAGATTDIWTHNGYAYTGTFSNPCGGDPEAGIWIWDVHNKNNPEFVGIIPSPTGSRTNDVRVASMNSGDILVHSNESCGGGPGGFEVWNVNDPTAPMHLASVQTDDVNELLRGLGFVDSGVHNLWLFSRDGNDYVAATVESEFGNFQIFDLANLNGGPVGFWGAESIGPVHSPYPSPHPFEDYATLDDFGKILDVDSYLFDGFGASQNRFLHDVTINAEGTRAYLANWDAGLVLLDISDVTNPTIVSVALDPANGSIDGEVNSHAVWPSEDGAIVVEGEEDFSVFEGDTPFQGSLQFLNTIPGVGTSTNSGNTLEASPTGNTGTLTATTLTVDSGPLEDSTFEVLDMNNNSFPLGAGSVNGNLVWIGRACNGDPIENIVNEGDIAIARRGACFFSDKAANAAAEGAAAIVIANNQEDSVWSGLRIWDYSDESNPVLKSTFNTVCSADPSDASCDPAGTYSVHNVVVETTGNKTKAYVSWYSDGMLVLDASDPANPVEIARFLDGSTNGGEPNDFWGVYKETHSPWIYGSDRNGGLYVFKEKGAGSAKNGAGKKP